MRWSLIVAVLLIVGLMAYWTWGTVIVTRRRAAGDDQPQAPPLTAWLRRWRAAKGKGDNLLTRPLIRFNASGRGRPVQVLSRDRPPDDTSGA